MMNRKFRITPPSDSSESTQMKQYEFTAENGEVKNFTVDAPHCQAGRVSTMTYGNQGVFYRSIEHESLGVAYGGHPSEFDLNQSHSYLKWAGRGVANSHTMTHVPIRKVAITAHGAFPELSAPVKVPAGLWDSRYSGDLNKVRLLNPSLNTGFSLVNFILQWKDARAVFRKYIKPGGLKKEVKHILNQIRAGPTASIRELANQRLEYVYGTKQFVQDVLHIIRTFYAWRADADKLASLAGQPRAITKPLGEVVVPWLVRYREFPYNPFGLDENVLNKLYYIETWAKQSHVTCVYTYTCPQMTGFLARVGQFLDALGVSANPSIAWDAIPFSFIIDWFYNVGDWLNRQRTDWTQMRVTFAEYGTSAKFTNTKLVGYSWFDNDNFWLFSEHEGLVIEKTYTCYTREMAQLPDSELPTISNPEKWSIPRVINATSLATQKLLKKGWFIRDSRPRPSSVAPWTNRPYTSWERHGT